MASFLPILLIFVVLYLLLLRPQRQKVNAQRAMLASLAPGDRVVTAGGLVGTLESVGPEHSTLEVAPGVVIEVLTPAIARRLEAAERAAGAQEGSEEGARAELEDGGEGRFGDAGEHPSHDAGAGGHPSGGEARAGREVGERQPGTEDRSAGTAEPEAPHDEEG